MQAIPVQIIAPQAITDTLASYYTSPAKKKTIISKLTLTNHGTAAEAVDIHIVPSGGSATDANKVISGKSINNDEAAALYQLEGQVLPEGASIHAKTDTAASTNIVILGSGVEIV